MTLTFLITIFFRKKYLDAEKHITLINQGYFNDEPQIKKLPIVIIQLLKYYPEKFGELFSKTQPLFIKLIEIDNSFPSHFSKTLVKEIKLSKLIFSLYELRDDKWLISVLFGLKFTILNTPEMKPIQINECTAVLKAEHKYDSRTKEYTRVLKNCITNEQVIIFETTHYENSVLDLLLDEIYHINFKNEYIDLVRKASKKGRIKDLTYIYDSCIAPPKKVKVV
ncbi:MAG: hypothetical protein V3U92_13480 [Cellulophaga sp.]